MASGFLLSHLGKCCHGQSQSGIRAEEQGRMTVLHSSWSSLLLRLSAMKNLSFPIAMNGGAGAFHGFEQLHHVDLDNGIYILSLPAVLD